jgi:hypothetical protein
VLVRHVESDRMSVLRRGIELPDPGDPLRFVKEQLGATERPATARHALGTARCGPARRVVWGLGEKIPRLPAYARHGRELMG